MALIVRMTAKEQKPSRRKTRGSLLRNNCDGTFTDVTAESSTRKNKDQGYDHADQGIGGLDVGTGNQQPVEKEKPTSEKRKREDAQNDGTHFGRLGHKPIVG